MSARPSSALVSFWLFRSNSVSPASSSLPRTVLGQHVSGVRLLGGLLLAALLAAGCQQLFSGSSNSSSPEVNVVSTRDGETKGEKQASDKENPATSADAPAGLTLVLSSGMPESEGRDAVPVANAALLDEGSTQRLLSRVPPLEEQPGDSLSFSLRGASLPPPQAGETLRSVFPPPEAPPAPEAVGAATSLTVLRAAPEGPVGLAPNVSVTFSLPMVALSAPGQVAAVPPPVTLTPAVEGAWRWIGTRTVLFEPKPRFPMASEFKLEVPKGARSVSGQQLAETFAQSFRTPPPTALEVVPTPGGQSPVSLRPAFFLRFDQKIQPDAVLKSLKLEGVGDIGLEQVSLETLQQGGARGSDPGVLWRLTEAQADPDLEGRFLAVRPTKALPWDRTFTLVLRKGLPSAEGPLTTEKDVQHAFRTFGPLRLASSSCGWGQCTPLSPFVLTFSNPLDLKSLSKEQVQIEPALPGLKLELYGNTLQLRGQSKGGTTYRVTLPVTLKDTFGQTLEAPVSVSFTVGRARAALTAEAQDFVVLDPAAPPRFPVYSINHKSLRVRLFQVSPSDWVRFREWMREHSENPKKMPPGQLFASQVIPAQEPDTLVETLVDLAPALPKNRLGHVIVWVEPSVQPRNPWERQEVVAWVQSTRLGLTVLQDGQSLVAYAGALQDGAPLAGAQVRFLEQKETAPTDVSGMAVLKSRAQGSDGLVATLGDDTAFLPSHLSWWGYAGAWAARARTDSLSWYVFDDRKLYKPGEEVHLKGWIRTQEGRTGGDISGYQSTQPLTWIVRDSQGNELTKGEVPVNAFGGFDLAFQLPPTMNLGEGHVALSAPTATSGRDFYHGFKVQEFRRPEFEVGARSSAGPLEIGGEATASVSARYYAGGALSNAETHWTVRSSPGTFVPPNHDEYTFGMWVPWWQLNGFGSSKLAGSGADSVPMLLAGKTDSSGEHHLKMRFVSVNPPRPMSVEAEASVMDVNRQTWTSRTTLLVHPSRLYVGLKSEQMFVQPGEPLHVDVVVTDVDGKRVEKQPVSLTAVRRDWEQVNGVWEEREVDAQQCALTSASAPVRCTLTLRSGGTWTLRATVFDEQKRRNVTEITRWVSGGQQPPVRKVEQEKVVIIPDKASWKPGEKAQLLIMSPFSPAEGVLSVRRSGIVHTERFSMTEASITRSIAIEDAHIPGVEVQVELVGAAPRVGAAGVPDAKLPKRPAFASGTLSMSVPPLSRTLSVLVIPKAEKLSPGAGTQLSVAVRDAAGRPVEGAEVAVVAVDEAVLSLTGYRLTDPVAWFYAGRAGESDQAHLRQYVLLPGASELLIETQDSLDEGDGGGHFGSLGGDVAPPMMDGAPVRGALPPPSPGAAAPKRAKRMAALASPAAEAMPDEPSSGDAGGAIAVRSNFNPLALFAPSVMTDRAGGAEVALKLPDNLTRYRLMAVATGGTDPIGLKRFGMGESTVTARLPLMIRPSPPRFLNFGDSFELPLVVQNQTDTPLSVKVAVRATNAVLKQGGGREVLVPANDRVEVRLPAAAALPGIARFQAVVSSGAYADSAQLQLPVWTPATTEAFATYGQVDKGSILQKIDPPEEVFPEFGGLEISTASTNLQALTDAFLYLVQYPFDCAEQRASRILSIVALRDVLSAFQVAGMPSPEAIQALIGTDLEVLSQKQNDDGGFGFWKRGEESWPFLSIHVAHALARAKAKGYSVPERLLGRASSYLQQIEQRIPRTYSAEARRELIAYALYVRSLLGDGDARRARSLLAEAGIEKTPLESLGWILSVLSQSGGGPEVSGILRHLKNRVSETASTAAFADSISDGVQVLLHSNRRTDGILLEALIGAESQSDLIPKLVAGLLGARKKGRWGNTQENVFILLALDKYFHTYENVTPDFVARAWLGGRFAGEHAFRGRTTERHEVTVPMQWLQDPALKAGMKDKLLPLILAKEGPGRLYYRIGLRSAPRNLLLQPVDAGFTVERVYESVDKPFDVRQDKDGTWRIRSGARVRVKLSLVAASRRYHVALVDPLPAGLEPLNPALATTERLPEESSDVTTWGTAGYGGPGRGGFWGFWNRTWYEHQNLRDERVEAFTSLLWEGVHSYVYFARATTPGTFVVPPVKAEEMYAPETFGRGKTDRVIVE